MTRLLTFAFALLVITTTAWSQDLETGRRAEYVRTRTFQSLLWQPGIAGHYLAVDPRTAAPYLSPESSVEFSDSFWELRGVYKHRDYRSHVILHRGNNPLNNRSLGINPDTGEFSFTKGETPSSYWLVRYAGKYNGWDAYFIQTLAESPAGFDMAFVSVDPTTKAIGLSAKPSAGSYWHIAYTSDLPAETRQ
jgi:hypothetical protein